MKGLGAGSVAGGAWRTCDALLAPPSFRQRLGVEGSAGGAEGREEEDDDKDMEAGLGEGEGRGPKRLPPGERPAVCCSCGVCGLKVGALAAAGEWAADCSGGCNAAAACLPMGAAAVAFVQQPYSERARRTPAPTLI